MISVYLLREERRERSGQGVAETWRMWDTIDLLEDSWQIISRARGGRLCHTQNCKGNWLVWLVGWLVLTGTPCVGRSRVSVHVMMATRWHGVTSVCTVQWCTVTYLSGLVGCRSRSHTITKNQRGDITIFGEPRLPRFHEGYCQPHVSTKTTRNSTPSDGISTLRVLQCSTATPCRECTQVVFLSRHTAKRVLLLIVRSML
jgi:hypothetical protein